MNTAGKFLGMARVWRDGDQWKWVPVGKWAPEDAVIAKRYRVDGEDVIAVEHGGDGEFVRGAVKG
jgi:hypothetical protein